VAEFAMVDASLTFLSPAESGRPHLHYQLSGLKYRPHIVIGNPDQRQAIIVEGNRLVESYCGVAFSSGPSKIEANQPYPVTMMLMYWPNEIYDAVVPGAGFTLREGPVIVAFGEITRRWTQAQRP
jgi:hypothetical protein